LKKQTTLGERKRKLKMTVSVHEIGKMPNGDLAQQIVLENKKWSSNRCYNLGGNLAIL
jgi:hypothetical protein